MSYNFSSFKKQSKEIEDWLIKELYGLRTGRASPLLLDQIMIRSYDTRVPLKQVASVAIEDVRTLRLTPWDHNLIKEIEIAIAAANLGVSTAPDGVSLRVNFPSLTLDSRQALQKVIRHKFEEAKVSLRNERDKIWSDIQTKMKQGDLGEDDKFRAKNELQRLTDETVARLEDITAKKETEVLT